MFSYVAQLGEREREKIMRKSARKMIHRESVAEDGNSINRRNLDFNWGKWERRGRRER